MLRKKQDQESQTSPSFIINLISHLSPMKMLIYYLLLSSTVVKADRRNYEIGYPTTHYIHKRLQAGTTQQIQVNKNDRVVATDPGCKLLAKTTLVGNRELIDLTYTCSGEDTIQYSSLEKQIADKIYEGQEYQDGAMFFKIPGAPENQYADGSKWDTLHKIFFNEPDQTIVQSGLIKKQ